MIEGERIMEDNQETPKGGIVSSMARLFIEVKVMKKALTAARCLFFPSSLLKSAPQTSQQMWRSLLTLCNLKAPSVLKGSLQILHQNSGAVGATALLVEAIAGRMEMYSL